MPKIHSLTVGRAEAALLAWWRGLPRPLVDLSRFLRFDAYGVALLALVAWEARARGGYPRVLLPERDEVARRLVATGLFDLFPEGLGWLDRPVPSKESAGLFRIVQVDGEERIGPLVDALGDMLWARFPLGERTIRVLVSAVLELLQNIPHHAAAGQKGVVPVGFAALEEEEDHLHLAVVDSGVGLQGSLAQNPRFWGVSAVEALELVFVEGASRFEDPGRGGALRRIREVTMRHGGKLYVRSGEGVFLQEDVEWQVEPITFFPGVQVSLRLPKRLFL